MRRTGWPRKPLIVATMIAGLGVPFAKNMPRLVWNASASAPIGLYWTDAPSHLRKGDVVLAQPPRWAAQLAYRRGYLPLDVPLVKHVAALAGDTVCARGQVITVDDVTVAKRLPHDSMRRPLPRWTGCHSLRAGQIFLINPVRASFDGRYFGISQRSDVIGRLEPLWVR
jgi:conjugative transfer signal peptidase TraF